MFMYKIMSSMMKSKERNIVLKLYYWYLYGMSTSLWVLLSLKWCSIFLFLSDVRLYQTLVVQHNE